MNRRDFMRALTGLSGAALASAFLGACSDQQENQPEKLITFSLFCQDYEKDV